MNWIIKIAKAFITVLLRTKGTDPVKVIEQAAIETVVEEVADALAPYIPKIEQAEQTFFQLEALYRTVTGINSTVSVPVGQVDSVSSALDRLDFIAKQSTVFTKAISDHLKQGPALPDSDTLQLLDQFRKLTAK